MSMQVQVALPKTEEEILAYLQGLQPGERVRETGNSMTNQEGDVSINGRGSVCVLWDPFEDGNRMGTSITYGTRRVSDLEE